MAGVRFSGFRIGLGLAVIVFGGFLYMMAFLGTALGQVAPVDGEGFVQGGFVSFQDIEGGATDPQYEGWSEVLGFQHQISALADSGIARRGARPIHAPLVVVKRLDRASPLLAQAISSGRVIAEAQLDIMGAGPDGGPEVAYRITLEEVVISGYSLSGGADPDAAPTESLSLTYQRIETEFADGTQFSWDVGLNR